MSGNHRLPSQKNEPYFFHDGTVFAEEGGGFLYALRSKVNRAGKRILEAFRIVVPKGTEHPRIEEYKPTDFNPKLPKK